MNKNKYLKYKSKYINLKNQLGAGKYSGHVWAYDFDGVVHKLMKSGETYITPHRNPNHEQLSSFENDYSALIKHIFIETINDMNIGQQNGAKIIIISANYKKYKNSIYKLLNHFGIKINIEDIHMRVYPKNNKIRQLKVTRFLDDSIVNIKNIHKDKHNMPDLKQLIWVIPEYSTFFNIFLDKPFNLSDNNPFNLQQVILGSFTNTSSIDWGTFVSADKQTSIKPTQQPPKQPPQESKIDIIKLLSYNIDFNSNQLSKNNIEKFIVSKDLDLIGIQENFWNINYNKTVYDYISDTPKNPKYRSGLFIKKFKFKIIQQIPGNYTRGIVCCRLNHVNSLKNFIVINFHLEHFYNSALSGSNTIAKTIKLLTTLLEKINFNSDETILLMGDSNEFYEMYVKKYKFPINLKLKNGITTDIYLNTSNPTCCSHNGSSFDYRSDIIGSNINRFEKINGDTLASNNHSDHLPLLSNFEYIY